MNCHVHRTRIDYNAADYFFSLHTYFSFIIIPTYRVTCL